MPHWLTPVWEDHPVSQLTRWWLPSRIQRCRLGTSPDRSARLSTAWATPSSWMNTTPGTSVLTAVFEHLRALRATRSSSHEESSMASSELSSVVMTTRPTMIHRAGQNPSMVTPGSRSSSRNTNTVLRTIAPRPSVSTESGTTRNASAGHTTALPTPTTNPASNASGNDSIENPGRMAAKSHSSTAVRTVRTRPRHSTRVRDGRSAAGRTIPDVEGESVLIDSPPSAQALAGESDNSGASPRTSARATPSVAAGCESTSDTSRSALPVGRVCCADCRRVPAVRASRDLHDSRPRRGDPITVDASSGARRQVVHEICVM